MSEFARRWSKVTWAGLCLCFATAGFVAGRYSHVPPSPALGGTLFRATSVTAAGSQTASESREPGFPDVAIRGPRQTRARAAALEQLAGNDPRQAMALVAEEPNQVVRAVLCNAVLRGWARADSDGAAAWVRQLPPGDRPSALAAVFSGVAADPDRAVTLGERLCAESPADAATCGNLLIHALADAGAFAAAAQFASQGPATERDAWVNTTFAEWATYDPDNAIAALAQVPAQAGWEAAFQGVVTGWSNANPAALAAYSAQLPAGPARESGLTQALTQWAHSDPASALAWINQQPPDAACDSGLTTVATQPDLVGRRPDIAIECAVAIMQPEVRTSVLRMLSQSWAERDRPAAVRFITSLSNVASVDRDALAEGLGEP